MRIEQQVPLQLQNPALARCNPILAGIGQSHSSILQNETCCGSIKKWFGNLCTSISHGFQKVRQFFENVLNKFCCCNIGSERGQRLLLDQVLERQNQALAHLLNPREIEWWFQRNPIVPAQGGILAIQDAFPHLQFANAPQFKAAVVLMLDDHYVGFHHARVTMDTLENRFRGETAHILEQEVMHLNQINALRGSLVRMFVILVIDRGEDRFDGGTIYNDIIGGGGGSRTAWPEGLIPEQLAQNIANILPGRQNTAARNQITSFFLARQNNQPQ